MKHKAILSAAICFALVNFEVFGFGQPFGASPSNYVVIGAFVSRSNATQFVENVKKLDFKAISEINTNRNLYYVYVLRTDNKKTAFSEANKIRVLRSDELKAAFVEANKTFVEANKIRKETPFYDTWVYTGLLGSESLSRGADINPTTGKDIAKIEVRDVKQETPDKDKVEERSPAFKEPAAENKLSDSNENKTSLQNKALLDSKTTENNPALENKALLDSKTNENNTSAENNTASQNSATSENNSPPVADAEEGGKNFVFKILQLTTKKNWKATLM